MQKHLLSLSISLLLLGCGRNHHAGEPTAGMNLWEAQSRAIMQRMVTEARVTCAAGSECNASVGMLVSIVDATKAGSCTANLIGPDLAITNSHCIPVDLKPRGSNCTGRIWLKFPSTSNFSAEEVGCSQVLDATVLPDEKQVVPDFAVIRLDRQVNRPSLSISRKGFQEGIAYRMNKVNPTSKKAIIGEMESVLCNSVHGSMIVKGSDDDLSRNLAFGDCEVIPGNSGSALVDGDGKIRGVIQIRVDIKRFETEVLERLTIPRLEPITEFLSIGTSFACSDLPPEVAVESVPERCALLARAQNDGTKSVDELMSVITRKLRSKIDELSPQMDPNFEWDAEAYRYKTSPFASVSDGAQYAIITPICFKNSDALLSNQLTSEGYSSAASRRIQVPLISFRLGINRYLAVDVRVQGSLSDSFEANLKYSPSDLAATGRSTFQGTQGLFDRILFSKTLNACPVSGAHPL